MSLWRAAEPLLVASRSEARCKMLTAAGIRIEVEPADIDERALERRYGTASPPEVAALLAAAKARAVSKRHPGRIVLGADQTLSCEGRIFSKPGGLVAAREQLCALRGRVHELHSAVTVTRGEAMAFQQVDTARMSVREFSAEFLERYLEAAGPAVLASVGAYQLEGLGSSLFSRIEGDYFTILGLPLFPLLDFLRRDGLLAA